MATHTTLGRFGTTVTTETGRRINTAVNPMSGQIITAMLGAAVGIGLSAQGRLELGIYRMTVVAGTLLMTHRTDLRPLTGQGAMIIRKIHRVVESAKDHAASGFIMAFGADGPLFAQIHVRGVHGQATMTDSGSQEPSQNHKGQDGSNLLDNFRHRYPSSDLNL